MLCGVDEAGRGPLAGPVVAAALILPKGLEIDGLNDSKKLTAGRREELDKIIREQAHSFGIGIASVQEIEKLNILQANFLAMKRAVEQLKISPNYILVDGRDFPDFYSDSVRISGKAIVKGDSRSAVIAGASILAKVYRDKLMKQMDSEYPDYGFAKHKGYGTKEHREAIVKYGPCPQHRSKFIRNVLSEKETLI